MLTYRFVRARFSRAWVLIPTSVAIMIFAIGLWIVGPSLDTEVYRAGAHAFRTGTNLYDHRFPVTESTADDISNLPFTYPPFAAILFIPLSFLSPVAAGTVMNLISLACLWLVSFLGLRAIGITRAHIWAFPVMAAATLTEPFRDTISFGQINIILLTLVLIDVLVPHPRFTGILSGLAAAIKLTPAVAVVFFLVRRDWGGAIRMVVTAALATLLAAAIKPEISYRYWFETLLSSERIGSEAGAINQSLNGFLHRVGIPELWFVFMLVAVAIAVVAAIRVRNDRLLTISVVMLIALVCSPISWTHHWVWLLPLAIATSRLSRMWPLVIWLVALIPVHRLLPQNELGIPDWGVFGHLAGNLYLWLALFTLILAANGGMRIAQTPPSAN